MVLKQHLIQHSSDNFLALYAPQIAHPETAFHKLHKVAFNPRRLTPDFPPGE